MANLIGPRGGHINLDSYVTASPPKPPTTVSGFLVAPPKQINSGEKKTGSRKNAAGQINPDSFTE